MLIKLYKTLFKIKIIIIMIKDNLKKDLINNYNFRCINWTKLDEK